MKICIVSPGASGLPIPPVCGGAVENLIDIYLKYNELKFHDTITIYSCTNSDAEAKVDEYKYAKFKYIATDTMKYKISQGLRYVLNKLPFFCLDNAYISQVEVDDDYDVIVVENRPDYGMHFTKKTTPVLLHLHNDIIDATGNRYRIEGDTYDCIITVSEYIRNCVMKKLPDANVKTLYNGIDKDKFSPHRFCECDRELMRKKLGIKEDEKVLVFSGRINKEKGVKELILAFKQIYIKYNLKLVIVGSSIFGKTNMDSFTVELQEIADECKDSIIFTGYIDYEKIPLYYHMADLIVIPSVWEDPSPLTVYESLASGVPLIVSDSGGIPEIVQGSEAMIVKRGTDYVSALAEAIIRQIKKPFRFSVANVKSSGQFTVEKYCEKFHNIMESFK